MGNEQSCEAAATKARQEMVEFIHRNGAEESEKARILMDERAAKFRVDAALQQHQESEGLIQQSLRSEREEGEILSQDSEPAQIPFPQPSQVGSSQQVPDRSNVLAAWQPRIEKQRSHGQQPNAAATPDGEFIGFGYLEASQRDQTQAESSRKPSCPQPKAPVTPKAVSGANQKAPTSTNSIIKERSDGSRLTKPLKVGRPSKPTSGDRSDSRSGASASKPPAAATASSSTALPAKRPAQTAFADERRRSLATLPKIPKRSSVASPQSPQGQVDQLQAVGDERPPRWYKDTPRPTTRQKDKGTVDVDLSNLRDFIENAKVAFKARDKVKWSKAISDLRESLHTLIFLEVTGPLLKLHRTLDNEAGLPLIFDSKYNGKVDWPFDVQADAEELYNKWCRKVFETDILRGIQFGGKDGSSKNDASIKPGYKIEAKYHGNGDLKNGQWWPYQICALRDGAHGRTQGGICGSTEEGAYSCIMAGGTNDAGQKYPDEDYGEKVLYCGTDSTTGTPTDYTKVMIASLNNNPVRLIRSHKLGSKFAPKVGFRYDGLYDVTDVESLDGPSSLRQRHRFTLVRCPDQDDIRGGDGPERRPTKQEMKQYERQLKLSGKV